MKKTILYLIFVISLVLIAYFNSLHNPFIWDEEEIIVRNPIIKDWHYLKEIFKTNIFGTSIKPGGYYRPMYTLSFMLDYHLWGLNTTGYHIFNITLHILNSLLLCFLFIRLGLGVKIAYLAGILFALYPVNCEAVSLIAARVEPLAAFFSLLCFIFFVNGIYHPHRVGGVVNTTPPTRWGWGRANLFLSIIFFIMALSTKESVLILPFIALIYSFLLVEKKGRPKVKFTLIILISLAAIYALIRLILLRHDTVATLSLINNATLAERVSTLPRILVTYIALTVLPLSLKSEYDFVVYSFNEPSAWFGAAFLITLFFCIYRYLKPRKYAVFFSLWFLIGIVPYSNIIMPLHATLMEHWAYFSVIAFSALMSMAIVNIIDNIRFKWFKNLIIVLLGSLLIFYIVRIIARNKEWSDPFTLYENDSRREPDSFLLHCNLGVEYFRRGMMKEAEREFLLANRVSPSGNYDTACNNLGVIYAREGRIDDAISLYKNSIALNNYPLAYENLGGLYNKLGRYKEAVMVLEESAKLYPLNIEILYQLGAAYYSNGQLDLAKKAFLRVEGIKEGYSNVKMFLKMVDEKR